MISSNNNSRRTTCCVGIETSGEDQMMMMGIEFVFAASFTTAPPDTHKKYVIS